jgi:HEPN domain-containing protein
MNRPEDERAQTFVERADADLAAVRALQANDAVPDEIVGFHAQQCAEKLLKAVLAAAGVDFPRTHSIRFLLDVLGDHELSPPRSLHAVEELYPYAVQLRYDAPLDDDPLDREATLALLEALQAWTVEQLDSRSRR